MSNRLLQGLAVGVALLLVVAGLLMSPVFLQVRYTELLREQRGLRAEARQLSNRLAVLDRGAKEMLSRANVEAVARERFGLEYLELPENVGEAAR